jgi:hypothetical protein
MFYPTVSLAAKRSPASARVFMPESHSARYAEVSLAREEEKYTKIWLLVTLFGGGRRGKGAGQGTISRNCLLLNVLVSGLKFVFYGAL